MLHWGCKTLFKIKKQALVGLKLMFLVAKVCKLTIIFLFIKNKLSRLVTNLTFEWIKKAYTFL